MLSMSKNSLAFCVNNLILPEINCEEETQFHNSVTKCSEDFVEVKVELCSRDLWLKFYKIGTEMIITKAGRRMFPTIRTRIFGLKEDVMYSIILELLPVDNFRYRFDHITGEWVTTAKKPTTKNESSGFMLHPASPALGKFWIKQGTLSFDKIKLTNTKRPSLRDHVSLSSMHKYMAKIHVNSYTSHDLTFPLIKEVSASFSFPETTFIAVTAYQNNDITKLKYACNPFATGVHSIKSRSRCVDWMRFSTKYKFLTEEIEENIEARNFSKNVNNTGVLKIPIKFIIPPLHTNLMSDWSKLEN